MWRRTLANVMRVLWSAVRGAPIAHVIRYVEPDGSREVDFRQMKEDAKRWAAWCKLDGCTEIEIRPVYSLGALRKEIKKPAAEGRCGLKFAAVSHPSDGKSKLN